MKKVLLFVVLVSGFASYAAAQDIITKRDGTDIKAKTIKVSPSEVEYKNWNNLDGPAFILPASDVLIIRFENGTNYVMKTANNLSQITENSIFTNDHSILDQGNLKYYQLKEYYQIEDYDLLNAPKYGRGYPWLNLVFPGLSQYCMGEDGLGTRFLLMSAGSTLVYALGIPLVTHKNYDAGYSLITIGIAAELATTAWSIVNAYNVAKVKSLYISDLKNHNQGYSISLTPTVLYASTPTGFQPAPGLGLRVTF